MRYLPPSVKRRLSVSEFEEELHQERPAVLVLLHSVASEGKVPASSWPEWRSSPDLPELQA